MTDHEQVENLVATGMNRREAWQQVARGSWRRYKETPLGARHEEQGSEGTQAAAEASETSPNVVQLHARQRAYTDDQHCWQCSTDTKQVEIGQGDCDHCQFIARGERTAKPLKGPKRTRQPEPLQENPF